MRCEMAGGHTAGSSPDRTRTRSIMDTAGHSTAGMPRGSRVAGRRCGVPGRAGARPEPPSVELLLLALLVLLGLLRLLRHRKPPPIVSLLNTIERTSP